jgi:hypothetical protein
MNEKSLAFRKLETIFRIWESDEIVRDVMIQPLPFAQNDRKRRTNERFHLYSYYKSTKLFCLLAECIN